MLFVFLMMLYFTANTASRLALRTLAKTTKLDVYQTGLLIDGPTTIFAACIALFLIDAPIMRGISPLLVMMALCFGILQVYFGKLSLISQRHLDTVTYTLIRMLTVPVTVLFSTILFRESLNTLQTIGLALIMGGSFAVSSSGTTLKLQRPTKYEAYAVLTTIFLTGGTLYVNYAIDSASLASHLIVLSPIASIPGTLIAFTRRKSFNRLVSSKDFKLSALIGLTTALHIAAFWGAVSVIDNLSVISALSSFRIVTVFAASYMLLKERTSLLQKLAGSSLALAGLLLAR